MNDPHIILNLCLMPDEADPEGARFNQAVAKVSGELNALNPSEYLVNNRPKESVDSWTHCSVMHVRVPNDEKTLASLSRALDAVVGEAIALDIGALTAVDNSAFLLEPLIRGDWANAYRPSDMYWILVNRNKALLDMQERIAVALVKGLGSEEGFITPRGEKYRPHFTCWIKFKGHDMPLPEVQSGMPRSSVPCRVRLGNSGPIGQVRNFVNKAEKLAELAAVPLLIRDSAKTPDSMRSACQRRSPFLSSIAVTASRNLRDCRAGAGWKSISKFMKERPTSFTIP